jgi:microcystin-dependent protein|tara:strand:- start:1019 stop:1954 length:936 start_codon:yes stop_codon:yes gene_type:complete
MGAGDSIREYNTTAASNTSLGGINLAEGVMVPSDLNNALRQLMADLALLSSGAEGIDLLSLVDDDASAAIKLQAPATVTTTTTLTLPDGDGSADQYIKTDGSGTLSWVSPSSFSLPAGLVFPYAGATAPTGYLLCYGQTLGNASSGATEANDNYQALFDVIKVAYGNSGSEVFGNGDTVTLPDLRGRVIAGQDDMGSASANRLTNQTGGLDGDTLGATGGAETHTLSVSQLASHGHTLSGGIKTVTSGGSSFSTGLEKRNFTNNQGDSPAGSFNSSDTTMDDFSVANSGSGAAHNNVQPTIILNYIISTGS